MKKTNITRTTWILLGHISLEEAQWISDTGAKITFKTKSQDIEHHGKMFRVNTGSSIEIVTDNSEVETLLRLKYVDRLYALSWEHVTNHDVCTLSEVVWNE